MADQTPRATAAQKRRVDLVVAAMHALPDDEDRWLVMQQFCPHCGSVNPQCSCEGNYVDEE